MNMGPPTGREWGGGEGRKKERHGRGRETPPCKIPFSKKKWGRMLMVLHSPRAVLHPKHRAQGWLLDFQLCPPAFPLVGLDSVSAVAFVPLITLCSPCSSWGSGRAVGRGGREAVGGTGEGREDDAPGALGSSPARRSRGSTGGCLTPSAQVRRDARHPLGVECKKGERGVCGIPWV